MRRLHTPAVNRLEDQARQMLNLPQRGQQFSPVDPGMEQRIRESGLINDAGSNLRYDSYEYTVPEQVIYDPFGMGMDEVIPEHTRYEFTERPDIIRALGERPISHGGRSDVIFEDAQINRARGGGDKVSRKAGLDERGFSEKDQKKIEEAKQVIDKHFAKLIAMAGGGAVVGGVGAGLIADGDSDDNFEDAAGTAALIAAGGYGGHTLADLTYASRTRPLAERRQQKGNTEPLPASAFIKDAQRRSARTNRGAAAGAGAAALFGLTQALQSDEPQIYPFP